MAENPRFQVRDEKTELEKLDKAIATLGYKDRADWYRDMKRETIRKSETNSSYILKIEKLPTGKYKTVLPSGHVIYAMSFEECKREAQVAVPRSKLKFILVKEK